MPIEVGGVQNTGRGYPARVFLNRLDQARLELVPRPRRLPGAGWLLRRWRSRRCWPAWASVAWAGHGALVGTAARPQLLLPAVLHLASPGHGSQHPVRGLAAGTQAIALIPEDAGACLNNQNVRRRKDLEGLTSRRRSGTAYAHDKAPTGTPASAAGPARRSDPHLHFSCCLMCASVISKVVKTVSASWAARPPPVAALQSPSPPLPRLIRPRGRFPAEQRRLWCWWWY